jgi:hypothetical protein
MKTKTNADNRIVGRKVLIDWPMRWKSHDEKFRDQMRAEAERNEHRFGETGEVVAYNPDDEQARVLAVLCDKDGRLERFHEGAVTFTSQPKTDRVEELLELILAQLEQRMKP